MASYEQALQQLYRASVANFVTERKRLAAELRAAGDEVGAAEIAKRSKPVTSVWAVNQLYWQARDAFDDMVAAAARLRAGELDAAKAHRDAIATLRKRAAGILEDAGYGASDATLRRIASTLAALAAAGGFEPDPPGALAADRDPPGFDALGAPAQAIKRGSDSASEAGGRTRAADQAVARAAQAADRKRREAERARRKAERSRLQTALRTAAADVRTRQRTRASLEQELRAADKALSGARDAVKDLERQLAELGDED